MIDPPPVERRWLRLAQFLGLAMLFVLGSAMVTGFIAFLIAGGDLEAMSPTAAFADGPGRLDLESPFVISLGIILAGLGVAILLAASVVYRRPLRDFLWPRRRFDGFHFGVGFVVMAAIVTILLPIDVMMGDSWDPPILDPTYTLQSVALYIVAVVFGLLIAAAAEEVICRGVLLRITSGFVRKAWLLCVVNGLVFSALHFDPDPVTFVARAMMGITFSWATLRLGGLEFAIGAHLANNLVISLFMEPLSGAVDAEPMRWYGLAFQAVSLLLTVVFVERLARRYTDAPTPDLSPGSAA